MRNCDAYHVNGFVILTVSLFADFDGVDARVVEERWKNARLPRPTLTMASGHGIHAYWRLTEPMTDLALWSHWQKRLINKLNSDRAIHDPARLMRLPGFVNHKPPTAMCRIIDAEPKRRYTLASLSLSLGNPDQEYHEITQSRSQKTMPARVELPPQQIGAMKDRAKQIASKWPAAQKGQRNCQAFRYAAHLVKDLAFDKDQVWPILQEWNRRNRPPPLLEGELRQILLNAVVYGRFPVKNKAS